MVHAGWARRCLCPRAVQCAPLYLQLRPNSANPKHRQVNRGRMGFSIGNDTDIGALLEEMVDGMLALVGHPCAL